MFNPLRRFFRPRRIWVPFAFYGTAGVYYLVHARRDRSGRVAFKTVRVTPYFGTVSISVPRIDPASAWSQVLRPESHAAFEAEGSDL